MDRLKISLGEMYKVREVMESVFEVGFQARFVNSGHDISPFGEKEAKNQY